MTFEQTLAAELLGVAARSATLALDELTRSDERGTKESMPKKKASKKS